MEFEQYLERDILVFLDSKIEHKNTSDIDREEEYGLYLTKDYIKELNYALDNDELTKAKKLFDELKLNYSKLPKNSIESKKMYSLLEKMYEKIQDYVRIKEEKLEITKEEKKETSKSKAENVTEIITNTYNINTVSSSDIPGLSQNIGLPINLNINKIDSSELKKDTEKKSIKSQNQLDINSTKSAIKDQHKEKYYEEKEKIDEEPELITQNVFIKNDKNIPSKNENIETKKPSKIDKIDTPDIPYMHADSSEADYLEKELAEHALYIEKLKTKIIEKIVNGLQQKLEETNREQNKKIESIRKEMMENINTELTKRFGERKIESINNQSIENLKNEILNQTYNQATDILANKDNYQTRTKVAETKKVSEDKQDADIKEVKPIYKKIFSIDNSKITKIFKELPGIQDTTSQIFDKNKKYHKQTSKEESLNYLNKISIEKSKRIYSEATYYMLNNRYEDAARLFKILVEANPKNKAASIRLHECLEKFPELKISVVPALKAAKIEELEESNNSNMSLIPKKSSSENVTLFADNKNNVNSAGKNISQDKPIKYNYSDYEKEKNNSKKLQNIIPTIKSTSHTKHKVDHNEMRTMYEEAIYTMFQNNYTEAAKIFQEILNIKPDNKAAQIRLQECLEVISNA